MKIDTVLEPSHLQAPRYPSLKDLDTRGCISCDPKCNILLNVQIIYSLDLLAGFCLTILSSSRKSGYSLLLLPGAPGVRQSPPSITSTSPFTKLPASENRYTVPSAISFTVPYRCRGIFLKAAPLFSASLLPSRAIPSVPIIGPGVITFEFMPRGPYSMAVVADKASTPAFATATCACNGIPVK